MSTQNLGKEENGEKGKRVQTISKSSKMCRDESCESSEQYDDANNKETIGKVRNEKEKPKKEETRYSTWFFPLLPTFVEVKCRNLEPKQLESKATRRLYHFWCAKNAPRQHLFSHSLFITVMALTPSLSLLNTFSRPSLLFLGCLNMTFSGSSVAASSWIRYLGHVWRLHHIDAPAKLFLVV